MRAASLLCGLSVLAAMAGTTSARAQTTSYEYDALGRLVATARSGTTPETVRATISYDAAANRTGYQMTDGSIVPDCFYSVHDNLNGVAGSNIRFTISRTGPNCKDNEEIYYQFIDGTAIKGVHYTHSGYHVQFGISNTRYFDVATHSGLSSGPVEFTVRIWGSDPEDVIVDDTAIGRILPTAPTVPCTFQPGSTQVTAGYSARFFLNRTGSCAPDQTVEFWTSDDTAIAGTHYRDTSGSVTFPGVDTYTTVNVLTIGGSVEDGDARYFRINVSSSDPSIQPSGTYAIGRIHAPGDD